MSWTPDGVGPPTEDGPIRLTWTDAVRSPAFRGEQVRVLEVPDLGRCVSVTPAEVLDGSTTTATLLIPYVTRPAPRAPRPCTPN